VSDYTQEDFSSFFSMEIQEIKNNLTLSQVLKHYGLKPDKNLRLRCPFHNDRTPSLQVYYKTHTCYCFSTNCRTHGRAMDVIDFILHKEGCTKHEAILKAKAMVEGTAVETSQNGSGNPDREKETERTALLEQVFTYFKNGVHNSKPAKEYLAGRCLDYTKTEVGYNSGQFHHGKRKDEGLIRACVEQGILLGLGTKSRTGNPAYKPFGKWCVVFPLRDEGYRITGLYFRSTLEKKNQRHFYLKNRQGLYPHYPKQETRKLILTESIIDAASLLEQPEIKSKYGVLALYGTNGLTEEHQRAIRELPKLEEIIFFLNGDEAGRSAVAKYAPMLKAEYPELKITNVQVPENEDVNSLLVGHSAEILTHLIQTRKTYDLLFLPAKRVGEQAGSTETQLKIKSEWLPEAEETQAEEKPQPMGLDKSVSAGLDTNNPYSLKYTGSEARYQIKGFRLNQLDSLKITLQIIAS
jgi:DNA primase